MTDINSKQYWDHRFSTDWVSAGGHGQTRFFATLAAKLMPDWFKDLVLREQWKICDWGCAEGQGVDELSKWLGVNSITGVDISEVAIGKAQASFPHRRFKAQSLDDLDDYDVIFSSNTLEHFDSPFDVVARLAEHTKRFLVLLLPFQEYDRIPEHFFTFDLDNIPVCPVAGFAAVACRVVDAAKINIDYWNGKQILVVYARLSALGDTRPDLRNFFTGDDTYEAFALERSQSIAQQHASEREQFAAQLAQSHSEYAATTARLESTEKTLQQVCAELDTQKAELKRSQETLAERDQALDELRQAITEREQTVRELTRAIAEHDQTMGEASQECRALSAEIASLHACVERYKSEGEQCAALLTEARAHADAVERQLNTMLRSKTWRLRSAIRRLAGRA
ncbi:methyltransferase domain-containing protein [Paraburkholderia dipogonis]|uniref:Methyltransferase domain-containing protein n=1 Tax=Paraburkholderia dipogonis TaxID=1211383 RepID=A0A4Y8MQ58_9BURK|nr:class I SAM-dependent methyltransferase [Paraburkholderia dipogonis]TFE39483.1 methyltransferase domain-containing protein [Paraburkholderia dipogonis]